VKCQLDVCSVLPVITFYVNIYTYIQCKYIYNILYTTLSTYNYFITVKHYKNADML